MTGSKVLAGVIGCALVFLAALSAKIIYQPIINEIPSTKSAKSLFISGEGKSEPASLFSDETFYRGILHRHLQKKESVTSLEESLGAGVCVFDFNNDGWDDLFFITGSGTSRHFGRQSWWEKNQGNRLYRNVQGQYFLDVTETSGMGDAEFGLACASADIDRDGLEDLVVANKGGNKIYKNTGEKFAVVADAFKNDPKYFSTSIKIKDFDGDGVADILFGNYVNFKQEQNILELNAGYHTYKKTNFDPALYDAQPDVLYLGKGNFSFAINDQLLEPNKHGRTLGFYEGTEGLLALNDKGSRSQVVLNSNYKELEQILVNARDAVSVATPHRENEQLFVASDAAKGGLYAISITNHQYNNEKSWDYGITSENRAYLNGWAVLSADFNGDRLVDLFVANGSSMPHPDTDQTTLGQANTLLLAAKNESKFNYTPIQGERILSSRGAAYLDFNNDGALDIVVNNNNDYATLLTNTAKPAESWIGFKCTPRYLCESVDITADRTLYKNAFHAEQHYMSQSAAALIVRNPAGESIDISVKSEDGKLEQSISSFNQYYLINLLTHEVTPIPSAKQAQSTDNFFSELEELKLHMYSGSHNQRTTELMSMLVDAPDSLKLHILEEIKLSANRDFFVLADAWAKSPNPALAMEAIDVVRFLEVEQSIPTLMNLLQSSSPGIVCSAAKTFEFFFWKDEAVIERKNWAINQLISMLDNANREVVICAIDALAESESYRALLPLIDKLNGGDSWVASRAARALGMIRQTYAVAPLQEKLFTSTSPTVRAQALVALIRLNVEFEAGVEKKILSEDPFFNAVFFLGLRKLDDGVTATKNTFLLASAKHTNRYDFMENLSMAQLHDVYEGYSHGSLQNDISPIAKSNSASGSLSLEEFQFLRRYASDDESLAVLFLKLEKADQRKVFPELSAVTLRLLDKRDAGVIARVCSQPKLAAPESEICVQLQSMSGKNTADIAELEKAVLNSGRYELLYLINDINEGKNEFDLAKNLFLTDQSIADTDKRLLLENITFKDANFTLLTHLFDQWDDAGKIAVLNSMDKYISLEAKRGWLENRLKAEPSKAIEYRINRMLLANQKRGA